MRHINISVTNDHHYAVGLNCDKNILLQIQDSYSQSRIVLDKKQAEELGKKLTLLSTGVPDMLASAFQGKWDDLELSEEVKTALENPVDCKPSEQDMKDFLEMEWFRDP